MANYACVRTDKMAGTDVATALASAKFYNGASVAEIENGSVVLLGDYLADEREVRKATAVAANSKLGNVALVANAEIDKTRTHNAMNEFINAKGDVLKAYILREGDEFSITKEAFDAESTAAAFKVNGVVELSAGTKLKAVATATAASTTVGKIIAIEGKWYVIRVGA